VEIFLYLAREEKMYCYSYSFSKWHGNLLFAIWLVHLRLLFKSNSQPKKQINNNEQNHFFTLKTKVIDGQIPNLDIGNDANKMII
jgi:hypothetical protein